MPIFSDEPIGEPMPRGSLESEAPTAVKAGTKRPRWQHRRLDELEGGPLFLNDWVRALFIHFEVDPAVLRRQVPYELDLREGRAYVSLVAFTMRRLRPVVGGRLAGFFFSPMAGHEFLNVRTYIRWRGEPGIYFMTEWVPNRLSLLLGPATYGLPYRLGAIDYRHDHEHGLLEGTVVPASGGGQVRYRAKIDPLAQYRPCDPGTPDAFLLERYSAFTKCGAVRRRFRIWHPPWPQTRVDVELIDTSPLERTGPWFREARMAFANYSTGAIDVRVGRPVILGRRVLSAGCAL